MSWKLFAVKTLYRTEAVGPPTGWDPSFDDSLTLMEERVVLVKARSHAEAIRKGEREARYYAGAVPRTNPYGQRLKDRYLGAIDSSELFDLPVAGSEVFSTTSLVAKAVSDAELIGQRMGDAEPKATHQKRRNFLDSSLSGTAPPRHDPKPK